MLFLSSCSSVGEYIDGALIRTGIAKTVDTRNYKELLAEGNSLLIGKISVIFNGKDISKNCGITFNGITGNGSTLNQMGHFIAPTSSKTNRLYKIRCGKRTGSPHLNYTFKDREFAVDSKVTYIGNIVVNFTDEKMDDPYKYYQNVSPWIRSLQVTSDEATKLDIEKKYQLESSKVSIINPMPN